MVPPITIGTFNVENLFLRYKFFYPIKKKKGETEDESKRRLEKEQQELQRLREKGGYIKNLQRILEDKKEIKSGQTSNTAKVILANKPDILALQEVENMDALRKFNSKYLKSYYEYKILIDGNDPRMIDVCVLSKYPITYIRTNIHVHDPVTKKELFSRDCLEVGIGLRESGDTVLTLFVNHFKSQLGKTEKERHEAKEKRRRQARWVAKMLTRRYGSDLRGGDFVVLGDFNAHYTADELQPLLQLGGLENVVQKRKLRIPGQAAIGNTDRWTHYFENGYTTSQLDYILLSPSLAEKSASQEVILEKRGLADYVDKYVGPRFSTVGRRDTEASDHCAVFTTLQI